MWPFSKNVELSEVRKRALRMMDEQSEKDKQLAEIQPFIDPIIERALVIRRNYLEVNIETGDFKINEIEMGYIKKWVKLVCGKIEEPIMFLGMNII